MTDAASFGLRWLDDVLRVRKSACLVNRFGEQHSYVLASHGLAPRDVRALEAALADWADPREAMLWDRGLSPPFPAAERSTRIAFGRLPPRLTELYQAVPLGVPGVRDEQRAAAAPESTVLVWRTSNGLRPSSVRSWISFSSRTPCRSTIKAAAASGRCSTAFSMR